MVVTTNIQCSVQVLLYTGLNIDEVLLFVGADKVFDSAKGLYIESISGKVKKVDIGQYILKKTNGFCYTYSVDRLQQEYLE